MAAFNVEENAKEGTFDRLIEVSQGMKIVSDGPLSKMYTDALNEIYQKEVDPTTGMALETQALDSNKQKNLWLAAKSASHGFADQGEGVGMLYGVYRHAAAVSDVINVADTFSEMTAAQKANSYVILDTKVSQDNMGSIPAYEHEQPLNPFAQALEELCKKHEVPVAASLEEYLQRLKKE